MDLDARTAATRARLPDLEGDLRVLDRLGRLDIGAALNKCRSITERVLYELCVEHGVDFGREPTIDRMLGPLRARGVVPKDIALHVQAIHNVASPGSHHQVRPLSPAHLAVARISLVELLAWVADRRDGKRPRRRVRAAWWAAPLVLAPAVVLLPQRSDPVHEPLVTVAARGPGGEVLREGATVRTGGRFAFEVHLAAPANVALLYGDEAAPVYQSEGAVAGPVRVPASGFFEVADPEAQRFWLVVSRAAGAATGDHGALAGPLPTVFDADPTGVVVLPYVLNGAD